MDLLAQDFEAIRFQDVVDFCDQGVVENTVLDYKQVIPKDLAKHFSAMSNRYGGMIIIGVEEDPKTGLPIKYEGIANDGKQIDRIHQFANNVRPLPSYQVRFTDEVGGKAFLLVRISEGGAPPYVSVNDPTVHLRTGNITTPLHPADAEIVRELYAKRSGAERLRRANVEHARAVLLSLLRQQDLKQHRPPLLHKDGAPGDSPRFSLLGLDEDFRMLTGYLQPFYPQRELALPREMHAALRQVRVVNRQDNGFPDPNMRPMARGMYSFHWMGTDVSFIADQVYANGFFMHSECFESSVRGTSAGHIFLADIARTLYTTLLFGRKLYARWGYSGLVRGAVQLTGVQGQPLSFLSQREFHALVPEAISPSYEWSIAADTHQLGDDDWLRRYFSETMREIYWDLGVEDVGNQVFDEFLNVWQFR